MAWLLVPPVETAAASATAEELGAKIRAALRRSRKAGFVDRKEVEDFKFWQNGGMNSFSAFSKKFRCVDFFKKGKTLIVEAMARDSYGAYEAPKNEESRMEFSTFASDEEIGQALLKVVS